MDWLAVIRAPDFVSFQHSQDGQQIDLCNKVGEMESLRKQSLIGNTHMRLESRLQEPGLTVVLIMQSEVGHMQSCMVG